MLALAAVRLLGVERGTLLALLVGALPLVLLLAWPLVVVALALRARLLSLLGVVAVGAHLLVVAPALDAAPLPPPGPTLRVVTANLYVLNPDPEQAGRALRALRPDVLVVPELSATGLAALRSSGLLADLPHQAVGLQGRDETVGLFSRLPLRDVALRPGSGRLLPRATVTVAGRDVRVLAAHPLPPLARLEGPWRRSLADLRREARGLRLPAVMAGDFNADRDHAPFRALLGEGLRDAHDVRGRGLARTWPADRPLLHLDHVLVRSGTGADLGVRDVREVRVPGSDHLAVVAEVAVLPAGALR